MAESLGIQTIRKKINSTGVFIKNLIFIKQTHISTGQRDSVESKAKNQI